jgi:hypothetical protein
LLQNACICDFFPGIHINTDWPKDIWTLSVIAIYLYSRFRWSYLPGCFWFCRSLCSVTFESGSRLTRIQSRAFGCYSSSKSFCIPASLQFINGLALGGTTVSELEVEEGHFSFCVSGDFLRDAEGICATGYIGCARNAIFNRTIQRMFFLLWVDFVVDLRIWVTIDQSWEAGICIPASISIN